MRRPDPGVVDTLMHFPGPAGEADYSFAEQGLGQHRGDGPTSPIAYLYKASPTLPEGADPIEHTLSEMDRLGVERCLVELDTDAVAGTACREHPDRFIPSVSVDPNEGMDGVRKLDAAHADAGVRAASFYPAIVFPQVPINDRRAYPIYTKCAELDIPIFITVGVPGPRVPLAAQRVELLDDVCWFFPELKIVMRHGGEPWVDLAVKLMLRWPNLYYSTSAFAPKRYPPEIIHYLNSRGSDKILFAGYYAIGLTWDRVFSDLEKLELRDEVWPKFLRENALGVLGLGSEGAG
jgi:uncharacterized protein